MRGLFGVLSLPSSHACILDDCWCHIIFIASLYNILALTLIAIRVWIKTHNIQKALHVLYWENPTPVNAVMLQHGAYKYSIKYFTIFIRKNVVEIDSRWLFVISVGTFTVMFLETGTLKSLGVLLPELREEFTTYTWVIGLAIAVLSGFCAVTCKLLRGLTVNVDYTVTVICFFFFLFVCLLLFVKLGGFA